MHRAARRCGCSCCVLSHRCRSAGSQGLASPRALLQVELQSALRTIVPTSRHIARAAGRPSRGRPGSGDNEVVMPLLSFGIVRLYLLFRSCVVVSAAFRAVEPAKLVRRRHMSSVQNKGFRGHAASRTWLPCGCSAASSFPEASRVVRTPSARGAGSAESSAGAGAMKREADTTEGVGSRHRWWAQLGARSRPAEEFDIAEAYGARLASPPDAAAQATPPKRSRRIASTQGTTPRQRGQPAHVAYSSRRHKHILGTAWHNAQHTKDRCPRNCTQGVKEHFSRTLLGDAVGVSEVAWGMPGGTWQRRRCATLRRGRPILPDQTSTMTEHVARRRACCGLWQALVGNAPRVCD